MTLRLLRLQALALPNLIAVRREGLLTALRAASFGTFGTLIVLSPFRARFELLSRPDTPVYGDYTDFLLFWSDVAFLALLLLWGLSLVVSGRKPHFGPPALRWPVLGLLGVTWLSAVASIDPGLSAYNALRLTAAAALGLYVLNEIDSITKLALPLVAMIVLQAVVGIGQAIDQASVGLHELGELHLEVNAGGTSVIGSDEGPRQLRGYGLTDHPNILGGLLAIGLVLMAAAAVPAEVLRAPLAVVFALGTAALLLTFSRTGALAFGVALLFNNRLVRLPTRLAQPRRLGSCRGRWRHRFSRPHRTLRRRPAPTRRRLRRQRSEQHGGALPQRARDACQSDERRIRRKAAAGRRCRSTSQSDQGQPGRTFPLITSRLTSSSSPSRRRRVSSGA